jgi:hypothetical protein
MMHRLSTGEEWKEFIISPPVKFRYAVSSFGRLMSFTDSIEAGTIIKGSSIEEYRSIGFRSSVNGKLIYRHFLVHKLVAEHFIPKDSPEQIFVLHLDFNKGNNHISNLKWATKKEMIEHRKKNPLVIEGRKKTLAAKKDIGQKLTAAKVKLLKQKIFDPNRKTRMKMLARQFGISEMQLYRIKSGENWGHVKPDDI